MENVYDDFFKPKKTTEKGGPGSGNWGHTGLDGVHGGSDPEGGPVSGGGSPGGGGSSGRGQNVDEGNVSSTHTKWARATNSEVNKIAKTWSKKYDKKYLQDLKKSIDFIINRHEDAGDIDFTKSPSTYMQSLLNQREAANMALSYLKGGGYTIGD